MKTIHGLRRRKPGGGRYPAPTYQSYIGMKNRCLNPNQLRYKDYGGRGIKICDRWLHGEGGLTGLQCFIQDMGMRPEGMTLDRIDNDGDYCLENCKWSNTVDQANNSRSTKIVEINGVSMPFQEAVRLYGKVSANTAAMRIIRGWSAVKAITTPRMS